jgi:hypothetical protein
MTTPGGSSRAPESGQTRVQKVADLRAALDALDRLTRLPGEPSLREAVAKQARERLAEMDAQDFPPACGYCRGMPGHAPGCPFENAETPTPNTRSGGTP